MHKIVVHLIAICFLAALSYVPFPNFHSVSVQAFVSAALDRVNPIAGQMSLGGLYGN